MNPIILLVIGAVGLAGCIILLLLGLNMLREERGTQNADAAAGGPSASLAAPQAAGATPEPANVEPARAASVSSGANPFAGVTARLTGRGARGSAHAVLRGLPDDLTRRLMGEISRKP